MEDFSLHHLIGFMGGLQVNSLVSLPKRKKTGHSSSLFPFLFIFQFLNQCKNSILRDRFYHFIGQDFSISNPILLADQYHFHEYSFDVLVISDPFFAKSSA